MVYSFAGECSSIQWWGSSWATHPWYSFYYHLLTFLTLASDDCTNIVMSCTTLTGNAGLFLHRRKAEFLDPLRKVSNLLNSLVSGYYGSLNWSTVFLRLTCTLTLGKKLLLGIRYYPLFICSSFVAEVLWIWPNLPICLLLVAHMSIKERGHDIRKPEAGWDAATKSPKGLGLAHCYTVWWACGSSPGWRPANRCSSPARLKQQLHKTTCNVGDITAVYVVDAYKITLLIYTSFKCRTA